VALQHMGVCVSHSWVCVSRIPAALERTSLTRVPVAFAVMFSTDVPGN
jgi:hypothetical protein